MKEVTLPHPSQPEADQFKSSHDYASLGPETDRLDENVLSRENLRQRADEIVGSITYSMDRRRMTRKEAYKETYASFVHPDGEPDPGLREFGRVLLLAPAASRVDAELGTVTGLMTELRNKGEVVPAELKEHRARLVEGACEYNHMLTAFVEKQLQVAESSADALQPQDMADWLSRVDGNKIDWAQRIMSGVRAEVAAAQLLKEAGFAGVRHGTIEEDLAGQDILFTPTRKGASSVDVKTGSQRPELPVTRDNRPDRAFLSIDPGHLNGFKIDNRYRDVYIDQLRKTLF